MKLRQPMPPSQIPTSPASQTHRPATGVGDRSARHHWRLAALVVVAVVLGACRVSGADPVGADDAAETTAGRAGTNRPTTTTSMVLATPIADRPSPAPDPDNDAGRADTHTLVAHAIVDEVVAFAGPGSTREVGRFSNPNRHGTPMVFQALTPPDSELIDSGWIQVMLPIRPNGSTGWIRTSDVELTNNPFRIEVDVDDFTLTVYRENAVHLVTEVGIGEGATPTPLGTFFLTDLLSPSNSSGVYGPYAYGLSGFSETLTSFNGGQGVIGIHGTNQPDALGSRVSHGCVRVANETISEMASFLPLGTPVVIDTDPQPIVNAGT